MSKPTDINQQAADWFRLINADSPPTEAQMIACHQWLEASSEHEQAYARYQELWATLGALEQDEAFREQVDGELYQHHQPDSASPRKFLQFNVGMAAALVISLAAVWGVWQFSNQPEESFQTATGEQTRVQLADGSAIKLNTATEIHTDITETERRIYMERGEAYFEVSKDPNRPFIVYAGSGSVKALGTAFNVRVDGDQVEVTLVEGKVAVAANADNSQAGQDSVELDAGEKASYSRAGHIEQVAQVDTRPVFEWQERRLSFSDVPLHEVVHEINRYTPKKLVIGDSEISNEHINAYFLIDNLGGFLTALQELFAIQSTEKSGKIVLSRADFKPSAKK